MSRLLLIAEAANPEWVSVPLVGWSLATAIARAAPAHIVTHVRNRDAILRAGLREGHDFTAIDSDAIAGPFYRAAKWIRGGTGVGWTIDTAFAAVAYYYFEYLVWKAFGAAITEGNYSVVHRITPLSPTVPSTLASRCRRAGVPFVSGPLNGGVPWPKGFDAARRKEREWLSYVRSAYKLLPAYQSTLSAASALIAGSTDTLKQIPPAFHHKCIYLPENAIDPGRFSLTSDAAAIPLRACFVGRLVPYKGPDMLLEALAPLCSTGQLHIDIIGDGPLMGMLCDSVTKAGLASRITMHGWVDHACLQALMCKSQLLVFPSIREFGGGVVLEAMALGIVPIVIDYAGPGELVTAGTGFKIPLGSRAEIVANLRAVVAALCAKPESIATIGRAARQKTRDFFTWDAKAGQVMQIYDWVLGRRHTKPVFFSSHTSGCDAEM